MSKKYRRRVLDSLLERKLRGIGAVLIEGPKLCGKTTTAEQIANSVLYMAQPDEMQENLNLASIKPALLLKGDTPRLIDEWQLAPKLWDAVRFEVDHRGETGQFILTGSAVPADRTKIFHTGTGRIAWLKMRTMSLYESGESNGDVSLKELFDGKLSIEGLNTLNLEDVAYLTCRGGWPTALDQAPEDALERAFDYYDAIVNVDVSRVDGVKREPERTKRLMRSYARNLGSSVPVSVLCSDMTVNDDNTLSPNTINSYINALKQIFVIEDLPAWNPNLRSKTAVRTADTRYFSDPSIGVAALGLGPNDLIQDLKTFGFFFETLCMRDLRIYADALNGTVYHYRDKNNLECDAVVHLRNGQYGLIEIKLGGDDLIEAGASTLKRLSSKIDTDKMNKPTFLMVLTAVGRFAYQRDDGVLVVPIGCLKD